MTEPLTKAQTQARADLEQAALDPINEQLLQVMRVWGEEPPTDELRDLAARTDRTLAALRSRQRRLTKTLLAAGLPPRPVFDPGERVCLCRDESVIGTVGSLTPTTAQVHLATGRWICVPHHAIRRLVPRDEPDRELEQAIRHALRFEKRQHLAKTTTK